jgi:16S rRNA (guanine966-N2)-methyltransferase
MRIISGKYKGKKLLGFNLDGTRPTMDRVKESLFASIQNYIPNSICLDLFAGSGALGIEAISMGAQKIVLIDNNQEAINTIKTNTQNISENIEIKKIDYKKYLKETKEKFDIIFLDPPYDNKLLNKSLKYISEYNILKENGIIICEYEKENPITSLKLIKEKKYGTTNIKIFKKE